MLKFRQWRAIHCNKNRVVILGARCTGKSYTAERFAARYFQKRKDVIFLVENRRRGQFAFNSICDLVRKDGVSIRWQTYSIESIENKNSIKFALIEEDCEDIIRFSTKYRSCPVTFVADEITDVPKLLCYISYLESRYNLNVEKVFVTGSPLPKNDKKTIKSINSNIEVFTWKGECL